MANIWDDIKENLKGLAGGWASYTAIATFVFYLVGYLSLRFHLTVLGIGTDLSVIDERYFYAGAKFFVYIVLYIPVIIMLALLLAIALLLIFFLLALVSYLIYLVLRKLFPGIGKSQLVRFADIWRKAKEWGKKPNLLALTGILFSTLFIQLVMRQCLFLSNLLLVTRAPEDVWVASLLKDESSAFEAFFFSAIVAGTAVTGGLLLYSWGQYRRLKTERLLKGQETVNPVTRFLLALLTALFVIQFLLLPVNHGVFIADKMMPKVKDLGGVETLQSGQEAWLVWEGNDTVTYLVESAEQNSSSSAPVVQRRLVTLPKKEIKRTEIIEYDQILQRVFSKPASH